MVSASQSSLYSPIANPCRFQGNNSARGPSPVSAVIRAVGGFAVSGVRAAVGATFVVDGVPNTGAGFAFPAGVDGGFICASPAAAVVVALVVVVAAAAAAAAVDTAAAAPAPAAAAAAAAAICFASSSDLTLASISAQKSAATVFSGVASLLPSKTSTGTPSECWSGLSINQSSYRACSASR